jgi:hypothetical protein
MGEYNARDRGRTRTINTKWELQQNGEKKKEKKRGKKERREAEREKRKEICGIRQHKINQHKIALTFQ